MEEIVSHVAQIISGSSNSPDCDYPKLKEVLDSFDSYSRDHDIGHISFKINQVILKIARKAKHGNWMNILSQEFEGNSSMKKNLTFSTTTLNKAAYSSQEDRHYTSHHNAPYHKKNHTERILQKEDPRKPPIDSFQSRSHFPESKSYKNVINSSRNLDYNSRRLTCENPRNNENPRSNNRSRSKTKS